MRELRPGLWHWEARHPEWHETEPWDPQVSSYAVDRGDRLLLFDPIAPPDEIENLVAERNTAIVLTAPWHERDSRRLVEQYGVPVYTPLPDTAEHLMEKWGLTAEQAGDGSPDVVWLLKEGIGEAHPYAAGDDLDVGVHVFPGQKPNDMVLWVEKPSRRRRGRHAARLRQRTAHQPSLAGPGHDAGAGRRESASAARLARGTRARDARRAFRTHRTGAGDLLTTAGASATLCAGDFCKRVIIRTAMRPSAPLVLSLSIFAGPETRREQAQPERPRLTSVPSPGPGGRTSGAPPRVLVVDDEPAMRALCRVNLQLEGLEVLEAQDGREAITLATAEHPDLMLLDVMMPGVDGWQVALRLQADPETRDIPIVFMTALAAADDRRRGAEAGAVGYLTKPFDPLELGEIVRRTLERLARGEREALRSEIVGDA